MFIQLWDWDSHSAADLIGLYVVDVRPAVYSQQKAFAMELWNGRSFEGTLFVNVHITNSSHLSPEQVEEKQIIQKMKQEKRRSALQVAEKGMEEKMSQLLERSVNMIEQYEDEVPNMLIELEILRLERATADKSNFERNKRELLIALFFSIWTLGFAGLMMAMEDWDYSTALYWATVTITTIGYGDVIPESRGGRAAAGIWIIGSSELVFRGILSWLQSKVEYMHFLRMHTRANTDWLNAVEKKMQTTLLRAEEASAKDESTSDLMHLLEHHGLHVELPESRLQVFAGHLVATWLGLFLVWLISWVLFFTVFAGETMDFEDAIWFAIISASSVGYGDFHAEGQKDKQIYLMFNLLFGVAILVNLATSFAMAIDRFMPRKNETKTIWKNDEDAEEDSICNLKRLSVESLA